MRRVAFALFGWVAACGGLVANEGEDASQTSSPFPVDAGSSGDGPSAADAMAPSADGDSAVDALADAGADGADAGPDPCADAAVPPATLECTGLYSDFATQTLSPNAQSYAPAVPLWSDGAAKERWIELPAGQKIDISDSSEWVFPIGTKVFKQFTYAGRRVETRLFQKIGINSWVHATYAWSADQTATSISYGEAVPVDDDGGTWVIPTPDDCDSCHRGRSDRILGFEQVSLGLAGATGLTLAQLVAQNLVAPVPARVNLAIGDDGTGFAAPALAWLHVNCGVTCHNSNENAQAYGAKMILRLDPAVLDGTRSTSTWGPLGTTVGVPCVSGSVLGIPRIVAGDPPSSAIIQLISQRGALQMPPIASRVVDSNDVALVANWIQHMASATATMPDSGQESGGSPSDAASLSDAGSESAAPAAREAGSEGAVSDAPSTPDSPVATDAAPPVADATLPTGEVDEAGTPDAETRFDGGVTPDAGDDGFVVDGSDSPPDGEVE